MDTKNALLTLQENCSQKCSKQALISGWAKERQAKKSDMIRGPAGESRVKEDGRKTKRIKEKLNELQQTVKQGRAAWTMGQTGTANKKIFNILIS